MTKADESPEEAPNPYWSDELLAVLAEALGDEDRARQTLEGIIQQAQEGKAVQTANTLDGEVIITSHRALRTHCRERSKLWRQETSQPGHEVWSRPRSGDGGDRQGAATSELRRRELVS